MNTLSFKSIELQPQLVQLFQQIIQNNRLVHAYIFYGPKATQKYQAAVEFVKAMNCENNQLDACDQCPTCMKITNGNHPDVVTIEPQGAGIKIDQLRQLKKKFHYQAPAGITRTVIIKQAEQMRAEAANSLLKFLEEPATPMVAILLTEKLQLILPTIQSRCQKIRFSEGTSAYRVIQYQNNGFSEPSAKLAAQLSDPIQMSAEQFYEICQLTMKWAEEILSNQFTKAMMTWLQFSSSQLAQISLILDLLLFWLRDCLYYQNTGKERFFSEWTDTLQSQASLQTSENIMIAMKNVMIARRLLEKTSYRPQDILEQMLISISQRELSREDGWQLIVI